MQQIVRSLAWLQKQWIYAQPVLLNPTWTLSLTVELLSNETFQWTGFYFERQPQGALSLNQHLTLFNSALWKVLFTLSVTHLRPDKHTNCFSFLIKHWPGCRKLHLESGFLPSRAHLIPILIFFVYKNTLFLQRSLKCDYLTVQVKQAPHCFVCLETRLNIIRAPQQLSQ